MKIVRALNTLSPFVSLHVYLIFLISVIRGIV